MPQFLVAIHLPDDFVPSMVTEEQARDIDRLNEEMIAAGVRSFVCGLRPPAEARSLSADAEGGLILRDGPYLPGHIHVGGFWVLEAADIEAAQEWGRKAVVACRAPVEVRPLYSGKPT